MVREWDPRTASSGEIESLVETINATLAADLPEDPAWERAYLREYLTETMPGERRIAWIVEGEPTLPGWRRPVLGHANILLLGDIGVVELIVHPAARRCGLGRALLGTVARRAYQEESASLGVEVIGGTPAVPFFEAMGFAQEYVETRSVLRLSTVDWGVLGEMARGIGAGYRVEFYPGGPPDTLLDAYARAKAELRDTEDAELDLHPSSYDPQRLRDSLDCLHRRGLKPYIVLAIHERTGEVAGLTEVVVPAQHPRRADQYDTIVRLRHRGYGIDRAVKARMLFELRSAEPNVTEVQTWNAQSNEWMLKVNAELGFQPDRDWLEYGRDVADLVVELESREFTAPSPAG
jgi:GNAT superfamily N-acetyltransferase